MLPTRFVPSRSFSLILVILAVAGVTALGKWIDTRVENLSHISLYLIIVATAALIGGGWLALFAFVLSGLAILQFFVLPNGTLLFTLEGYSLNSDILSLAVFILAGAFIAYLVSALRRERDIAHALAERERTAREAIARASVQLERAAGMEERNRIARDLHDSLAQTINYIGLKTQLINELLVAGEEAQVKGEVARVHKAAERARTDVREVLYGLRHTENDRPLAVALADLVREIGEQSDVSISLDMPDPDGWPPLTVASQIQLLRIVREALANVAKHARATHAELKARYDPAAQTLEITLHDNGIGFVRAKVRSNGGVHLGLRIMQERAAELGAELSIESTPGTGTTMRIIWAAKRTTNPQIAITVNPLP